ncbi:MAG: hypothetical protein A3G87_04600 [Omnitrophica bacterium RIFCSPLOWO2_12_FULL_50_11]|nr:MAG: hypothetical protein A3G87_04600 [Omnitrophica bacterium RIFCSPLOWO2_12_FULL_50_11]
MGSLLFCATTVVADQEFDHSKWDYLLSRFVQDGRVDYKSLASNRDLLDGYLRELETFSVSALSELGREERIAFWVNLYHASVIRIILDDYPVASIEEIPAVYETRTIRAIGDYFSLIELRDHVLRRGFRDERVLVALVSGRMDSPRLLGEAFRGDRLDEQLDRVSQIFVDDGRSNRIIVGERKIYVSPLFQDFGSDFILNFGSLDPPSYLSEAEASVIGFILHHSRDPAKRLFLNTGRYQLAYLPRDARLNDISNIQ